MLALLLAAVAGCKSCSTSAGVTLGDGPGIKLTFAYDDEFRANSRSHTIQAELKLRW